MDCLAPIRRSPIAFFALAGALTLLSCHNESTDRPAANAAASPSAAPEIVNLPSTRETAEATPSDVALASKIEAALAAETALHGSSIAVKAVDGVVTLTGSTNDSELRSMAAQVALSLDGVRSVRNELTIAAEG